MGHPPAFPGMNGCLIAYGASREGWSIHCAKDVPWGKEHGRPCCIPSTAVHMTVCEVQMWYGSKNTLMFLWCLVKTPYWIHPKKRNTFLTILVEQIHSGDTHIISYNTVCIYCIYLYDYIYNIHHAVLEWHMIISHEVPTKKWHIATKTAWTCQVGKDVSYGKFKQW